MKFISLLETHSVVENLDIGNLPRRKTLIKNLRYFNKKSWLSCHGLYKEADSVKSSYFIGMSKYNDKIIYIQPKIGLKKILNMFSVCLSDEKTAKTLEQVYHVFFEEEWIEVRKKDDIFSEFIIFYFLKLIDKIVKKGLKKAYKKKSFDLKYNVKGKIDINRTVKKFNSRGNISKFNCNYFEYTKNNIENAILKLALLKCTFFLQNFQNEEYKNFFYKNLIAFKNINHKKVTKKDLIKIKKSVFFKEYEEAIKISKIILKDENLSFGVDKNNSDKIKIPPFYIDVAMLFEKYTEVVLRKNGYSVNTQQEFDTDIGKLRPDFVLDKIVIDAKYKLYDNFKNKQESLKKDLQQVALYLNLDNFENGYIIYPSAESDVKIKVIKGINNLNLIALPVDKDIGRLRLRL